MNDHLTTTKREVILAALGLVASGCAPLEAQGDVLHVVGARRHASEEEVQSMLGWAEYVALLVDPGKTGFSLFGEDEDVVVGHWLLQGGPTLALPRKPRGVEPALPGSVLHSAGVVVSLRG